VINDQDFLSKVREAGDAVSLHRLIEEREAAIRDA
jgi:hypothetical protein